LALVQVGLALFNIAAALTGGALWWFNVGIAAFCAVFVPFHLRMGCQRRSAAWWAQFYQRRSNSPWN